MRSILMSQKMITKTSQNDHKISFWAILMKFICDLKIDIIMVEPHHVKYFFKTPSTVQCFDFLTYYAKLTILIIFSWRFFDTLAFDLLPEPPQFVT